MFKTTYSSVNCDLHEALINPLLSNSIKYDRAVGFFSSSWLREVAEGLAKFTIGGGKARIMTSVRLSNEDWEAIQSGSDQTEFETVLLKQVEIALDELQRALETKTLGTLSWLISQGVLEFRFALPIGRLKGGIFHTKLSLFYDELGDGIAVFGSQNDSFQASLNEETLSVYTSWGEGSSYFLAHQAGFEEKWNGNKSTLLTFSLPEAVKNAIIEAGEKYHPSQSIEIESNDEFEEEEANTPGKQLRDYQKKAIEGWRENSFRGLFEMATGTGKTFTAISAALSLFEERGRLAIIVLAPYTHLVEQWSDELKQQGYSPVVCYGSKNVWEKEANSALLEFKSSLSNNLCIVSTHATASLEHFRRMVDRIPRPWLLVADEVHGLGSVVQRNALYPNADYRIGLSATAARWFDEEGTQFLKDYFERTVIEYGLEDAINSGALTKYLYTPIMVELDDNELLDYEELTEKINKLSIQKGFDDEYLQHLCRKRAKILSSAGSKIPALLNLVKEHRDIAASQGDPYLHNLFYCSPGEHDILVHELHQIGLKVHKFVHDVSQSDRAKILKDFARGDLQGIVAIKCLDEGVDVPATKRAYILASTSNPKEFVQRRGRVLRRFPGKTFAYLYDFVVGPWSYPNYNEETAKSLLRRELPRVAEFNDLSITKHSATEGIYEACRYFGMGDALYLKPWDLYKKMRDEPVELALT